MTISQLEEEIKKVESFVREDEERIRHSPNDKIVSFFAPSMKSRLDELRNQLYLEKAKRAWESIEFHLHGNQITDGSIPLRLLNKITHPLNSLIESTAWYMHYGDDSKTITDDFIRDLDLRLGGVTGGSTKIYIIGKINPDLAGDSALETALKQIFAVLHAIGSKATNSMKSFLSALEQGNVKTDISWNSPDNKKYYWRGKLDEITRFRHLIDNVSEQKNEVVSINGEIILLSRNGKITVMDYEANSKVEIRYPFSMFEKVKPLHLGMYETFWVNKVSYFDKAKNSEHSKYSLISIGNRF